MKSQKIDQPRLPLLEPTNPSIPLIYNTSPFTLTINESAHNGKYYSIWSITFSTTGWPKLQGSSVAIRKSGNGVSN